VATFLNELRKDSIYRVNILLTNFPMLAKVQSLIASKHLLVRRVVGRAVASQHQIPPEAHCESQDWRACVFREHDFEICALLIRENLFLILIDQYPEFVDCL
jgi:hypothetical protein